jgi:hypothetical protein
MFIIVYYVYLSPNYHKRAVDEFGNRNKGPPKRIVFFRDGLSEGEYAGVGNEEIEDIKGEQVQWW